MSSSTAAPPPPPIITVLPGDDVTKHIGIITSDNKNRHLKLGTGLRYRHRDDNDNDAIAVSDGGTTTPASPDTATTTTTRIIATCAGRLHHRRPHTWFVWTSPKRYIPQVEDRVVGVVMDRAGTEQGGDVHRVHIFGPHPAMLSNLHFEGATKRNKPHLTQGTLVYARVSKCHASMDPTLSCQLGSRDSGVPRKDWMTNEGTYGELKGGTVQQISIGLARELLHPGNVVLQELSVLPFEVCIGVNGVLWVHSERPEYTILVLNAIANTEVLTEEQTRAMVQTLIKTVQRQIQTDEDD